MILHQTHRQIRWGKYVGILLLVARSGSDRSENGLNQVRQWQEMEVVDLRCIQLIVGLNLLLDAGQILAV